MTERAFVDMMSAAIIGTDGTEAEALAMFEMTLLDRNDPRLVWELFEPVRATVLRRLYGMARHQLDQPDSKAQPRETVVESSHLLGAASEPDATADSPAQAPQQEIRHSAVATRGRSPRGARSAQDVLISIGGKKSHLDWLTNHRGVPIGDLTYYGLANSHDEAPMFQRFASRLMESGIPKSDRASDVVRKFITPDEADRIWLDLLKDVA